MDQHPTLLEAQRIEEDCLFSGKAHFEAAKRWNHVHLWLGVPATVLAALSGISVLKQQPEWAVGLAITTSTLTALLTFLNPQQRANTHHQSGTRFFAIRDEIRIFRQIEWLEGLTAVDSVARLKHIAKTRSELNQSSPPIPRHAYESAKKGIEAGEHTYRVDANQVVSQSKP